MNYHRQMNPKNRILSHISQGPTRAGMVTAVRDQGTKQVASAGANAVDLLAAARARGRRWAVEE
ncbi:hypothetical protein [Paraburkholderia monticola]|uniref:hypothetical protein n=1 Tax=Paraburkholderia monticola TaxID=1399968 RepID=UPI000A404F25|nr:hypothetical protein [Paraburkholderia monticola]